MVINDFYRKTIFLDTAPLIYFIEGNSVYQEKRFQIFQSNSKGDFIFITSSITLLEVLIKPIKEGMREIANQYKHILTNSPGIIIFEITNDIAASAANLRASYNLKTPDAIQIATAIEHKADYFLTNDFRLKSVEGITSVNLSALT